jgi:hypothetical protein
MSMFQPTRDEARTFLADAWRKHRAREPLAPIEAITVDIIAAHPEYHLLLESAPTADPRDFLPEAGEANPFLHLHLHLALAEQLSIDQPPGIVAAYRQLLSRHGEPMAAQHAAIDCLAETLWRSQRDNLPPDGEAYLECVRRTASGRPASA